MEKNALLSLYWFGKAGEVQNKDLIGCISLTLTTHQLDVPMRILWYPRHDSNRDPLQGYSHVPFNTWTNAKEGQYTKEYYIWPKFQVEHWKDRHKVDRKGHWIEFFSQI